MQVPNVATFISGASRNIGFVGFDVKSASMLPRSNGRGEFSMPGSKGPERSGTLSRNADGDILDLDWTRISRFVQRFAWQGTPSDPMKIIKEHIEKRVPVFNSDGDRAEFGSGRSKNSAKLTYGPGDVGKASTVEPKGNCSACDSRKYVDKSSDASVSYQTPTRLNPQMAALAVGAHEREHVTNERAKADREGREIVNQTVSIKYSVCPECNIMYASGGTTRTQSVQKGDEGQDMPQNMPQDMPRE